MLLAKTYEPNQYEPEVYALWETSGQFRPSGKGEPYAIVMPPPNANGNLHIGHALTVHLEDILVRFHRMKGRDTIYLPGADHAGFETWVVYERELAKEGKSRFDFSREQLYSQVWNFVDSHRGNMELQVRALGASASWENSTFTLDQKVVTTVYGTFRRLWNEGLIYRGERIVNYSTTYQTSYADIEVDHKEEQGTLWNIAYPTYDKIGEIIIATTRPETMLGDTAIAVHPDDERYKDLIGTRVMLPLVNREIPIVADEYVDPTFGTGAVKVTPAHDPNDFEIGQRHDLEMIQVIDFDGTMKNVPAQFEGLPVLEARKRVLAALKAAELLRGEETITHTVGYDYKSGEPIQPLLKEQWFLKVRPLAEAAKQALLDDKITFSPASKKQALIQYYDNLKDWNLSRQIPWGIPIPVFQNVNDPDDWIYDERVDEPTIDVDGKTYKREEDTFDTWFSSGQWPFITTDALEEGSDLSRFYPTSVLETGHDILYAWISRMIMLGLYVTGEVPFRHVYLHGLVLDENGQKMSKSKGNVVNPMEMVAQYGSDALRMGIVAARSAGQNQAFSESKVVTGRNFCNKLWNIARYVESQIGDNHVISALEPKTSAEHWIIRQLDNASKQVSDHLKHYRFAEAAETVYHTIWGDVADWYIESSKTTSNNPMLSWVLATSLKLTHPFAPFVTETIWQTLNWTDGTLMTQNWPHDNQYDHIAAAEFDNVITLVNEARFVIAELPGNQKQTLLYQNDQLIELHTALLMHLLRLAAIEKIDQPRGLRLAVTNREAWLDISEATLYEHQSALEVRLQDVRTQLERLEARLNNESYLEKAPAKLVEETRELADQARQKAERLSYELDVIELA